MNIQINNPNISCFNALHTVSKLSTNSKTLLPFKFNEIIGIFDGVISDDFNSYAITLHPVADNSVNRLIVGRFDIDYDQSILTLNAYKKQFGTTIGSPKNTWWFGFINKLNNEFIKIGNNEALVDVSNEQLTTYIPIENVKNALSKWKPVIIVSSTEDIYPIAIRDIEINKLGIINPTINPNLPFMEIVNVGKYVDTTMSTYRRGVSMYTFVDSDTPSYKNITYSFYEDHIFDGTIAGE